ncbi:uncharacterized protein LOC8271734 [Ricinus communis]|uniref:uncharacterized protein LOC8271734 n=1 Tax=Ricinus communis TaxID=3988 RepID=UPI00201A3282|nr:uncharacterized protein LOC8271734 [Ricinus communis]
MESKVSNFIRRALTGSLATSLTLAYRNITTEKMCGICANAEESLPHALMLCPYTTMFWFASDLGYKPDFDHFARLEKEECSLFKNEDQCPLATTRNASRACAEFQQTVRRDKVSEKENRRGNKAKWNLPERVSLKLTQMPPSIQARPVVTVEGEALLKAVKLAKRWNLKVVLLESDSSVLIHNVDNDDESDPIDIRGILSQINMLKYYFHCSRFCSILREGNSVADRLAKMVTDGRMTEGEMVTLPFNCTCFG